MFKMQQGETIVDVQKHFTHIVSHLFGLGKTFDFDELNVKILKSLNRTGQPKVTIMSESQNLSSMSMAVLFGKLREHELKLSKLTVEKEEGKKKTLTFKSKISKGKSPKKDEDSEDEHTSLIIKSFTNFMKTKGKNKFRSEKNGNQGSSSSYKC